MSLADSLKHNKETNRGPKCSLCTLLVTMDAKDRKILQAAIDDPSYTHAGISRALIAEGMHIKPNTIQRHRHGMCMGKA